MTQPSVSAHSNVKDNSWRSGRDETLAPPMEPETALPALARVPVRDQEAPVSRAVEAARDADTEAIRDASQALARQAWIAFRDACEAGEPDQREMCYIAARSALQGLWGYAKHRDEPFRDLLAMLTAAIKYADFESFDATQRDVLRAAFRDLGRWLLDGPTVEGHIDSFAEHGVDITGPIRGDSPKRFRISLEPLE